MYDRTVMLIMGQSSHESIEMSYLRGTCGRS